MSHRDRDSDSKRRHSKFDREPSPKRYRRDGKQDREKEREKERERVNTNGREGGGNQNHHSKQESIDAAHKKSNQNDNHEPPKHSSQPSRSRIHHQRDERCGDVKVGRRTDRREDGEKVVTQSKEKTERAETSQSKEQRDEKSRAKLDDNYQRKAGFPERKEDLPPNMRKRPAFREKKIPVDSGDASVAATVTIKPGHADQPSERNEMKEERSNNPSHLDRPERQNGEDRAPNKREPRRDGFSSRVRYGGSGGNSNYRGRDKFNGGQGYQPIKTRAEKWKHDLYQEVNKDPIPKNEDDQIAKLEALLAS